MNAAVLFCLEMRNGIYFCFELFSLAEQKWIGNCQYCVSMKNNAMRCHVFDLHSEQIAPFFV